MSGVTNDTLKRLKSALSDKDPLVYIASPFFDEKSKQWVSMREEEYRGMGIPYYSPREDGLSFKDIQDDELRAARIKAIFLNNVRNLDICKHIIANFVPVNGVVDLGTLWEYGYHRAKHGKDQTNNQLYSFVTGDDRLIQDIHDLLNNLDARDPEYDPSKNLLYYFDESDLKNINFSKDLLGMNFEPTRVGNLSYNISRVNNLILTDGKPPLAFVLMGYMYAKNWNYYTCSFKGYDSNIMIAASSLGHIQLPGVSNGLYHKRLI